MTTKNDDTCTRNNASQRSCVKILILGEIGVGKTALINTYLQDVDTRRDNEYDVLDVYHTKRLYKGNEVDVHLIDLFPGTKSPDRRECYPSHVDAVLLCFAVDRLNTLKSVYNLWIHEVRTHFGKLVPVFLVGLRSDMRLVLQIALPPTNGASEECRVVEKSEAEVIHKNYKFHGEYMECSMLDLTSVTDIIQKVFLFAMENKSL